MIQREWREGKVRPLQGNTPHDRPVSRGICFVRRICDDPFLATPQLPRTITILRRPVCVFKAWRNLSVPMSFKIEIKPWGGNRAASRRSAPSPGRRTRREDSRSLHRSQMSSGRLFLDGLLASRARLRFTGHAQINMHSREAWAKGDISTLLGRGHFYFALTNGLGALTILPERSKFIDTPRR